MTGAEFSEVDFDLLADYVGGALTGTPDEATVAARIAENPAWQSAYDELAEAMASVGAQLNAFGATSEPMPADLAQRLDAAFTSPMSAVSDPAPIDPELAAPAVPFVVKSESSERHLAAVPDRDLDRAERPPAGARKRRLRWAVPVAAAAGVIAFLGVGINYLNGQSQSDNATSSAAGVGSGELRGESIAPKMAPDQAGGVPPPQVITSKQDYQRSTLSMAGTAAVTDSRSTAGKEPVAGTETVPTPLVRLTPGTTLAACIAAIAQQNGAGEITTVQAVEYARYEGSPAVIVRFTAANGQWVWATRPDCGLPGAGAAQLASVKVG